MMRSTIQRLAWWALRRAEHLANGYEQGRLRKRLMHIGSGGTLGPGLHVKCPERVWIGDNVHVGKGGHIRADGGLRIGSNTHISRNVVIYTVNHDYEGERLPYDERLVEKPVEIGESVWIGMNVCIAPGSRIGDGAIVGLGAVVAGEVPPMAIVVGPRARVIGERDRARYDELKAAGRFGGPDGIPFEGPGDRR